MVGDRGRARRLLGVVGGWGGGGVKACWCLFGGRGTTGVGGQGPRGLDLLVSFGRQGHDRGRGVLYKTGAVFT